MGGRDLSDRKNMGFVCSNSHIATKLPANYRELKDLSGPATDKIYLPHCNRPRLYNYKRSYSLKPQSQLPVHLAKATWGCIGDCINGAFGKVSKTLTPWTDDPGWNHTQYPVRIQNSNHSIGPSIHEDNKHWKSQQKKSSAAEIECANSWLHGMNLADFRGTFQVPANVGTNSTSNCICMF